MRPIRPFILAICALLASLAAQADHGFVTNDPATHDHPIFDRGATVFVRVNQQSFMTHGFPASFSQQNMQIVMQKVISNYREYADMNLSLFWGGFTGATEPAANEILIIGRDQVEGARAKTLWSKYQFGRMVIEVGLRRPSRTPQIPGQTDWVPNVWKMFTHEPISDADMASEVDVMAFDGVMMHEFGHALGLGHNEDATTNASSPTSQRTVMNNQIGAADSARRQFDPKTFTWAWAYGPYLEDVEDLRALYGTSTSGSRRPELRIIRSTAGDFSSSAGITANYTSGFANWGAAPVSAVLDNPVTSPRSLVFYKSAALQPRVVVGNNSFGTAFTEDAVIVNNVVITGVNGHGFDGEYMAGMVTTAHALNIRRSANGGVWSTVALNSGAVTAFSYSAPAIYKAALNTWVVCYASTNLRVSNGLRPLDTNLGKIFCRVSTNNGSSWTGDIDIGTGRALRGLSITRQNATDFVLGYANAASGAVEYANLRLSGSSLSLRSIDRPNQFTAAEPSLTTRSGFVQSTREDHWLTNDRFVVNNRASGDNPGAWSGGIAVVSVDSFLTARPALVAHPNFTQTYMLYVK